MKRNIKLEQVKPQLLETLWRTSVEDLDPETQFEEIKKGVLMHLLTAGDSWTFGSEIKDPN